jgi:hypothetical protein
MYPSRNPFGGSGYDPRFAGTFMSGGGGSRPSQQQRLPTNQQGPRSTRSQQPDAPQGTITSITPGDPHYYGTRLDRAAAKAINTLCRCQNPGSHTDAWAFSDDMPPGYYARDQQYRPLTWRQVSNRVLDICNKAEVSREEELETYRYILHPRECEGLWEHHRHLDFIVGIGGHIVLTPYGDGVQAFTGDGHVRNNITSEGLRTQYNPTVLGGQNARGSSRSQGPGRGQNGQNSRRH